MHGKFFHESQVPQVNTSNVNNFSEMKMQPRNKVGYKGSSLLSGPMVCKNFKPELWHLSNASWAGFSWDWPAAIEPHSKGPDDLSRPAGLVPSLQWPCPWTSQTIQWPSS